MGVTTGGATKIIGRKQHHCETYLTRAIHKFLNDSSATIRLFSQQNGFQAFFFEETRYASFLAAVDRGGV